MRYYVLLLFFIIIGIGTLAGQAVNDFELEDIDRNNQNLSDLQGHKLTIIDFWATWCLPCQEAMKELVKLYPNLRDNGVEVIGINVDGPRNISKVKPFIKTMGITYPILMDTNMDLMSDLGVSVVPTIIIINDEKKILYAKEGYQAGDDQVLRAKIDELLETSD